jgi:nucleotide-binding universal stress UspA family protein
MKTILVPTDFSPNADKALNFAVHIARKTKAKIILVHACDLLELTFKDNLWLKKQYNQQIISEANDKLVAYCQSIQKAEKVTIRKKLYHGLVTDTIIYAAKTNKADLIIMGTLGSANVKEKIFGSKTASVIGRAAIPVLAIPLLSEWKVPEHILLTIKSFNEGREEQVRPLLDLAEVFGARITIAKFIDHRLHAPHKQLAIEKAGNQYIKKVRSYSPDVKLCFVHPAGHRLEKNIDDFIAKNKVDMLGMITHRRNFLNSIFHRSMTRKMSYHVAIPLLALPAPVMNSQRDNTIERRKGTMKATVNA